MDKKESNDDCLYRKNLFGKQMVDPLYIGRNSVAQKSTADSQSSPISNYMDIKTSEAIDYGCIEDEDIAESLHTESEEQLEIVMVPSKTIFSKYDFVKVQVYLSDSHHYILSRFLISRVLTATLVKHSHAIRIALNLKKCLVDKNLLRLSQHEMESNLFEIMKEYGYEECQIQLYRMMSVFHNQRVPMVILVGGQLDEDDFAICTKLAERLNMPSVLKTSIFYELMEFNKNLLISAENRKKEDKMMLEEEGKEEIQMDKWLEECRLSRLGLQEDIRKCAKEGKNFIIEGKHVNQLLLDEVSNFFKIAKVGVIVPFVVSKGGVGWPLLHEAKEKFYRDFVVIENLNVADAVNMMHFVVLERMKMSFSRDFVY